MRQMSSETTLALIATMLVMAFVTIAMSFDFSQEQEDQTHYCEMVRSGAWGDYNGWMREGLCDDK